MDNGAGAFDKRHSSAWRFFIGQIIFLMCPLFRALFVRDACYSLCGRSNLEGYTTRLTLDGIMNYLLESVDVGVYGCLAPLRGVEEFRLRHVLRVPSFYLRA